MYALTEDGAQLWTTVDGPVGAPPLVLCHGGPGLWDYLGPVAGLLSADRRTHRFDQRGCGRSTGPEDYSIATAVADLDAVRARCGLDRWAVFGHSWGATLALAYAWAHPDRVTALVYCSGVGPGDGWRAPFRAEYERRLTPAQRARHAYLEARESRSADEETEYRILAWTPDHADRRRAAEWAAEDAAVAYPINVRANRELAAEAGGWPAQTVLARTGRLRMPALFLHGGGDPRPAANVRQLAQALPGAEFVVLDGAGHSPWREQPTMFAATVGAFLRRATGGGAGLLW
ncbi:alpha/beta hydrolase [Longispora sp. K20-0274]|uniref:alpha/beta fold hydrolase n=1 Tax=Longispora sp. K20-0274 TaxID=3088255 RepID=UPI0039998A37